MARALLVCVGLGLCHALKANKTQLTACTCSCCEASAGSFLRRTPTVCTPLFTIAASSCPGECNDLQAATATALQHADLSASEESAVDYARFCLQSCTPPAAKQALCTPSVPLPSLDSSLLIEGAQGGPVAAPAPAAAETGTQVAEAEGQKAAAMALEAKVAQAEAMAAAAEAKAAANLELAQSRGSLAEEITSELKNSAERAGVYAASAREAVKKAEKALEEIEDAPKLAAAEASKVAIRQLQQQKEMNQQVVETFEAHAAPTAVQPSAAGANKAAEPYNQAIQEAQKKQGFFEAKAAQLKDEAERLQAGVRSMDQQLEAYGKNPQLAKVIRAQSHDLLVKSLEKETAAEEAMDEGRKAGQAVPKFTQQAAAAVARASMMASTKWMPPSVAPMAMAPAPAMAAMAPAAA